LALLGRSSTVRSPDHGADTVTKRLGAHRPGQQQLDKLPIGRPIEGHREAFDVLAHPAEQSGDPGSSSDAAAMPEGVQKPVAAPTSHLRATREVEFRAHVATPRPMVHRPNSHRYKKEVTLSDAIVP
jgi:hypothetical protein